MIFLEIYVLAFYVISYLRNSWNSIGITTISSRWTCLKHFSVKFMKIMKNHWISWNSIKSCFFIGNHGNWWNLLLFRPVCEMYWIPIGILLISGGHFRSGMVNHKIYWFSWFYIKPWNIMEIQGFLEFSWFCWSARFRAPKKY